MTDGVKIMGIINVTPDSFYSGSRCCGSDGNPDCDLLRSRISKALDEGADIIDIGACSTRPGSDYVSFEEEWARLLPALRIARSLLPGRNISVDTFRSDIVSRTYDEIGPFIVNDISAGEEDSSMLPLVGRLGLGYVAMHKRGTPSRMQSLTEYHSPEGGGYFALESAAEPPRRLSPVTLSLLEYFREFGRKAEENGITDWILDPGFGFAKTVEQNYRLLSELSSFRQLGRPVLVGISRKSMIYRPLGLTPEDCLAPTQVLNLVALQGGASILRVHDVAPAVHTLSLHRLLRGNL